MKAQILASELLADAYASLRNPTGVNSPNFRTLQGSTLQISQEPYRNPTGTLQEPYRNPTGTLQEPYRNPTGTLQEPGTLQGSTLEPYSEPYRVEPYRGHPPKFQIFNFPFIS
jgi:hypothetical protein